LKNKLNSYTYLKLRLELTVNYFKNLKILNKLIIIFLILTIIPFLILGILTFSKSSAVIMQEVSNNSKQIVRQVSDKIDYNMKEVDKNTLLFVWSSQTQTILESNFSKETLHKRKENQMELESTMQTFLNTRNEIESIYIYRTDGDEFYIDNSTYNKEVRKRLIMKRTQIAESSEMQNGKNVWISLNLNKGLITGSRVIYDTINLNKLGLLIINIQEKYLRDLYSNIEMSPNSFFIIKNQSGEVVSTNSKLNSEEINNLNKNLQKVDYNSDFTVNGNYFIVKSNCEYTGWEVLGFIPKSELVGGIIKLGSSIFVIGIICAIISIILLVLLSTYIFNPIKKLTKLMKKVEQEDFSVKAEIYSKDELGELTNVFNKMIEKIRYLIEEVYKQQIVKKEAEFKLLQAQINPHFLYNTLDSINWIAKVNGVEDISKMVVALGQLMRVSIAKGKSSVTLEEDLDYINNYFIIQRMRYRDKFKVTTEIDEVTKKCIVPKMLLQPIVENALVHGIEKKMGKGSILIRAGIESGNLLIDVIDDGLGMNEEKCKEILKIEDLDINISKDEIHTGIGVSNVNRRIKMLFGQEFGISIQSEPGKGTRVQICLPKEFGGIYD
jgi:two-component system, sensor histidine kinase YesM